MSSMQVNYEKGVFYIAISKSLYKDRRKAKDGGWIPHWGTEGVCSPDCPGCSANLEASKVWCTKDPKIVLATEFPLSKEALVELNRVRMPKDASRAQDANIDVPMPPGRALRPYQKAAVFYAQKLSRLIIADEMGIGKTIEAIAIANYRPGPLKILVICPASLKTNWEREIRTWEAHNPRVVLCDSVDDVPDKSSTRLWCITNPERLISTCPPTAAQAVEGSEPASDDAGIIRACKAHPRARVLCVSSHEPEATAGKWPQNTAFAICSVGTNSSFFAEHDGPVVQIANPAYAKMLACRNDCWTHVVGKSTKTLYEQERAGGLWTKLMGVQWDILIIDEAHRLSNLKAAGAQRVLGVSGNRKQMTKPGLAMKARQVIALTGTPIPNRVRDLWALAHTISPATFAQKADFLFRYCGPKQCEILVRGGHGETKNVWTFDGASNLSELQRKLRTTCLLRRRKQDVLTELPSKTRQIIPLPADSLMAAADSEREGWLKFAPRVLTTALDVLIAEALGDAFLYDQALDRLNHDLEGISAANIAKERQALALAKLPMVIEHVRGVLEAKNQKVVVMAHHHSVLEELNKAFQAESVMVSGETPIKVRQDAVDAFQNDPAVRVFIGGMHAAGVGLTLTAADTMVFAEGDWEPHVLIQCEDRIHRIGQSRPVLIQHMVVDGTIEAIVIASVVRKQKNIDRALDEQDQSTKQEKVYPKATGADRCDVAAALNIWQGQASKLLPHRLAGLVRSLYDKMRQRVLTDGEVWLCKKIAREYPKSLPAKLSESFQGTAAS